MPEKRKLKRRHLIYYLQVIDRDKDKSIGFLVDITTNGIMIMNESPVETDKTFHLKVQLQTDLSQQSFLDFKAKSKWCKKSINADLYDTGFELIGVTAKDFRGIEDIISELGFAD